MTGVLFVVGSMVPADGCGDGCRRPSLGEPQDGAAGPVCARARDIPRVDMHTHVSARGVERALAIMDRRNVAVMINASGGTGERADESARIQERTQGRIRFYCNVDFGAWGEEGFVETAVEELRRCRRIGGSGLKFFKSLGLGLADADGGLVPVDDPRLDPLFEQAGVLGLPVLIHSGDPKAFFEPPTRDNERFEELEAHPSWSFHGEEYPSWEEVYAQFERRVARHPDTVFIGAHFGNNPEDPERVFRMMADRPNLYVDTAARVPEIGRFDPDRMRALFVRFQDRILFGTDIGIGEETLILGSGPPYRPGPKLIDRFFSSTWRYFETEARDFPHPTPIQGEWTIDGIGLGCDVLEKVYRANAVELFDLPAPQPDGAGR